MVTAPHLQNDQRLTHRRLYLHRLERDDTIDKKAQPHIGHAEGPAAYLRRLPEQHRADSPRLKIPYHPISFHSHIILLHKHLQMTERVDNKPTRLNIPKNIIQQAIATGLQHETRRGADHTELILLFQFSQVPPEILRVSIDLVRKLFEGHVDSRFA